MRVQPAVPWTPGGSCVAPRIIQSWVPEGDAGVHAVLDAMDALVHSSLDVSPLDGANERNRVELVRSHAARIIRRQDTPAERARAIQRWLARRFVFLPDPAGREVVAAPYYLLRCGLQESGRIAGDCEDLALLAATFGTYAGLPARFVVIALEPAGPFQHVWAELWDGEKWLELDEVATAQGLPRAQSGARRIIRDVPTEGAVYDRISGCNGCSQPRLGSYINGTSLSSNSFGFTPGGSFGTGTPGGLSLDLGGWLGDAWGYVREALGDAAGDLAADVVGWIQQRIGREAWQRMPESSKRAAIDEATRDVRSRLVGSSLTPLLLLGGIGFLILSRKRGR